MNKHVWPLLFALLLGICGQALPVAAAGQLRLGVEGYRDDYREPDIDVRDYTHYAGLTAGYTFTAAQGYFMAADGRLAYGRDHYESPDGGSRGSPQYESEVRFTAGKNFSLKTATVSPYAGVGSRFYYDNSKNTYTTLGYYGYDRRIAQLYVPLGATWHVPMGWWTLSPNVEYDHLVKGWVNSRLQNGGYYNVSNRQYSGYGLRAALMFGFDRDGHTLEVGPFVRYWNVRDSNVYATPDAEQWVEPYNTRLQLGLAARWLFF